MYSCAQWAVKMLTQNGVAVRKAESEGPEITWAQPGVDAASQVQA